MKRAKLCCCIKKYTGRFYDFDDGCINKLNFNEEFVYQYTNMSNVYYVSTMDFKRIVIEEEVFEEHFSKIDIFGNFKTFE